MGRDNDHDPVRTAAPCSLRPPSLNNGLEYSVVVSLKIPHSGWRHAAFSIAAAVLSAAAVSSQQVDFGFAQRAHAHVEALAALGPRLPGSQADHKAEAYIAKHMRRAGLVVAIERFEFDSFRLYGAELAVAGTSEKLAHVILDPYGGSLELTGVPLFLSSEDLQRTDDLVKSTKGRIVIAGPNIKPFNLAFRGPRAAAVVSQPAFDRLKALAPAEVTLRVKGNVERVSTSNVVGTAGKGAGQFVMFTAHRDSVDAAPGADDNASGVAVLLELGRAWKSAGTNRPARFVALAAEELGFVGAKAYIARHRDELKRCALVFNMDTIGAEKGTWLDANGGVQGVEPDWMPLLRAEVGPGATWVLAPRFQPASNVPVWLRDAIVASAKQTGIQVDMGQFSGSDHLAFARAGVPATHIASSTGSEHTPEDTAGNVSEEALARAGRFAIAVAGKVE